MGQAATGLYTITIYHYVKSIKKKQIAITNTYTQHTALRRSTIHY